jgi:DNA repair exonuclease SbcCD ATPase subunit
LRLRFQDERTLDPITSLRVTFAQNGFERQAADEAATDGAGFVESRQPYRTVCFVQVYSGAKLLRAQMPVPVLDKDRIVVCRLTPAGESEAVGLLELDYERHLQHLREGYLKEGERIKELNERNETKDLEGALEQAEKGQKELAADINTFRDEASSLRERARALGQDQPERIQAVNDLLEKLAQKLRELEKYSSGLKEAVARQKDPRVAQIRASLVRAQALENQAEFAGAIAIYEQTIRDANDPELVKEYQKRLDKLKAAWTVKNDEHAKARAFIQDTWPKLYSVDELAEKKATAFAAIATCQAAGDYLTPQILPKANIVHAEHLSKRLAVIKRSGNAEGGEEVKKIREIIKDLEDLNAAAAKASKAP